MTEIKQLNPQTRRDKLELELSQGGDFYIEDYGHRHWYAFVEKMENTETIDVDHVSRWRIKYTNGATIYRGRKMAEDSVHNKNVNAHLRLNGVGR